jgi:hypothetical protein
LRVQSRNPVRQGHGTDPGSRSRPSGIRQRPR